VEGVLPSGEIAARFGIAAAALGGGTNKKSTLAAPRSLCNFAQ
jgi:hypothetical protein